MSPLTIVALAIVAGLLGSVTTFAVLAHASKHPLQSPENARYVLKNTIVEATRDGDAIVVPLTKAEAAHVADLILATGEYYPNENDE